MTAIHGKQQIENAKFLNAKKWKNSFFLLRLNEYEACDSLRREIMEQMTLRDQEPRTSQAFVNLSANIRLRLKQYTHQVQQLKNRVSDAVRQRKM